MNVSPNSVVVTKEGKFRLESGLPYSNIAFVSKNQSKRYSIFANEYSEGWLVGLVGNPFGKTFTVDATKPMIECKSVKLDRENLYYQCLLPYGFTQRNMSIEGDKTLIKEQTTSELKYYDVALREIKDLSFYKQVKKDFQNFAFRPNRNLLDNSFMIEFFEQFKDGVNPYKEKEVLKDAIKENKTLDECYNRKENFLTVEQAEEVQSLGLAMCASYLTDDYGNINQMYYTTLEPMAKNIVKFVKDLDSLEK